MKSPSGGTMNSLIAPETYLTMTTNTFLLCTKGELNLTVYFQNMLCVIQANIIEQMMANMTIDIHKYHYHIGCDSCIVPIDETAINLDVPAQLMMSVDFPKIEVIYIEENYPFIINTSPRNTGEIC